MDDSSGNDYVINTIYERGDRTLEGISNVIGFWHNRGWTLKHFSSDYRGMDGIFLIFERPKQGSDIQVYYYHGSNTNYFEDLP